MKEQLKRNSKNALKMRQTHHVMEPIRSLKLTIPESPALLTAQRAYQREKKLHAFNNDINMDRNSIGNNSCNDINNINTMTGIDDYLKKYQSKIRRPRSASPSSRHHNNRHQKRKKLVLLDFFIFFCFSCFQCF